MSISYGVVIIQKSTFLGFSSVEEVVGVGVGAGALLSSTNSMSESESDESSLNWSDRFLADVLAVGWCSC